MGVIWLTFHLRIEHNTCWNHPGACWESEIQTDVGNISIYLGLWSRWGLAWPSSSCAWAVGLVPLKVQSILWVGSGSSVVRLRWVWWIKHLYSSKCRLHYCPGCLVTNGCSNSIWTFLAQFWSRHLLSQSKLFPLQIGRFLIHSVILWCLYNDGSRSI